jgi:Pyruvate/2-oxoacid:ferredoxin oxidoreductase gamma subunit
MPVARWEGTSRKGSDPAARTYGPRRTPGASGRVAARPQHPALPVLRATTGPSPYTSHVVNHSERAVAARVPALAAEPLTVVSRREPVAVAPGTSIASCLDAIRRTGTGDSVFVTDPDGRLRGVLTERDVFGRLVGDDVAGSVRLDAPVEAVQELERVTIRFAGDSGDGMQLTGTQFTRTAAVFGNDISTLPDYPAEIRAPAGSLPGRLRLPDQLLGADIHTPGDEPDVLVAMNPAALKTNIGDLPPGGALIVNSDAFTPANLNKAGYAANPLTDGSLKQYTSSRSRSARSTHARSRGST